MEGPNCSGNSWEGFIYVFALGCGFFCLQLEASCLQWSFFCLQLTILAFLLTVGAFMLTILAFLLTVGAFCLQWESVSNKDLEGL